MPWEWRGLSEFFRFIGLRLSTQWRRYLILVTTKMWRINSSDSPLQSLSIDIWRVFWSSGSSTDSAEVSYGMWLLRRAILGDWYSPILHSILRSLFSSQRFVPACLWKHPNQRKWLPHFLHWNGFSRVWILWWTSKLYNLVNGFWHILHRMDCLGFLVNMRCDSFLIAHISFLSLRCLWGLSNSGWERTELFFVSPAIIFSIFVAVVTDGKGSLCKISNWSSNRFSSPCGDGIRIGGVFSRVNSVVQRLRRSDVKGEGGGAPESKFGRWNKSAAMAKWELSSTRDCGCITRSRLAKSEDSRLYPWIGYCKSHEMNFVIWPEPSHLVYSKMDRPDWDEGAL